MLLTRWEQQQPVSIGRSGRVPRVTLGHNATYDGCRTLRSTSFIAFIAPITRIGETNAPSQRAPWNAMRNAHNLVYFNYTPTVFAALAFCFLSYIPPKPSWNCFYVLLLQLPLLV